MPQDVFVVMPFGSRAHPAVSLRDLDFDRVYTEVIRPAAEDAGWTATRIDDDTSLGDISHRFIDRLFSADLVVADVSVPNGNVYYELGIRHGIATGGTILLAHQGSELPFDIRNQRVLFYSASSEGIRLARAELTRVIRAYEPSPGHNPVRTYLERVGATASPTDPARFEAELNGRIERATTPEQLHSVWNWAKHLAPQPLSALLRLGRRFGDLNEWPSAVNVLRAAARQHDDDYEVHRQLAWSLRKLDPTPYVEVEAEFLKALSLNSEDPEALGMLGGVYKRLARYGEASECYNRAARLAPGSDYILVNQAAMAVLSAPNAPDVGISLYGALLERVRHRPGTPDVWTALVAGEASFAVGDEDTAIEFYRRALLLSPNPVPFESAADQLELLGGVGFRSGEAARLARLLRGSIRQIGEAVRLTESAPRNSHPPTISPVLLHLSDLHFGSRPTPSGPVRMHRFVDGEYSEPLIRHFEREFKGHRAIFNYAPERLHLVISGDLTYTADSAEFEVAGAFIKELVAVLGISRERVHIVPGNHDVHWPSSQINAMHRFDNYFGLLDEFYGSVLFRERYPYLKWDLKTNTTRDHPGQLLSVYASDQIVVVGLNSCVYETPQDHFGFVGGRQMKHVDDWLYSAKVTAYKGAVRVAVVHHHLHPFPEALTERRGPEEIWQDLSTIRDSGLVERALELRGFDLVLHGHKHRAQLRETLIRQQFEAHRATSRLIVCGCGSTGVARTELEHGDGNHYEVIELLRVPRQSGAAFAKVHWRELAYRADAEWRTTDVWTVDG